MADREVEGVNLDELEDQYQAFEAAVLSALNATMRKAVREDAVAGTLPRLSLDDLNVIPGQWAGQVPPLAEDLAAIYVQSAGMQADAFVRAGGVVTDELAEEVETETARGVLRFTSEHAATLDYLTTASNRLVGIGDELWADARSELLNGMDLGEGIPALTNRVRKTVDVTEARARVIARTEAVGSSNAGSIAFMRATGEVATKAWTCHRDGRTRPAHLAADGQEVDLDAKFMVGGFPMDHPGDPAGPASMTIQCRCVLRYGLTPDSADLAQQGDTLAASAQEDAVTVVELPTVYVSDLPDEDAALVAALDAMEGNTASWEGVICVTGTPTGDRRQFDSLSWAELPLPLRRNIVESHGGIPQTQAVLVGRIDQIEMRQNEVWASGVIDLGSDAGRETARLMGTREAPGFLRGVSIDGDEEPGNPATIESVFPADCADLAMADGAPSMEDMDRCMEPELSIWSHVRVRGATLTDVPALAQANLYLTDGASEMPDELEREATMPTQMAASGEPTMADVVESLTAAAATIVIPDLPPAWWFDQPTDMPEIGAITVTDEGRLYGLLAPGGVAHRGMEKRTAAPTRNVDYTRWMNRPTRVEMPDGSTARMATGPITMNCGHVSPVGPRARDAAATLAQYDDSCSIFATACVGEDGRGNVWIAGAVLADVTASQVARALACQLSGDWRPHRDRQGWRELCGALLVPVPGFPVANRGARVTMQGEALVASAVPMQFEGNVECAPCQREDEVVSLAAVEAARILSSKVQRDPISRAAELTKMVRG